MTTLALDGNPHNTTALLAHCDGASNVVACPNSRFLFTVGGKVCNALPQQFIIIALSYMKILKLDCTAVILVLSLYYVKFNSSLIH